MEHRWGTRVPVDMEVGLRSVGGPMARAVITDISGSGAFIRTPTSMDPPAPVEILLMRRLIPAFVVRRASDGIGVEWRNPTIDLINMLRGSARGEPRGRAEPAPAALG